MLYQWKVSDEIDISHISLPDKDTLERVADTKHPFIFEKNISSPLYFAGEEGEVNIMKNDGIVLKVPHKAMISAVKKEPFLSCNNSLFLEKTKWIEDMKLLQNCDIFLKPYMNWKTTNDIIYGNKGVHTELCCSPNIRNYFAIAEGNVELKLCTPRCGDILNGQGSKSNISTVNPWNPSDKDTILLKECDVILIPLKKGSIIHIPAYWWYSIKFPELSCVISLSYSTYINALSQIPSKLQHVLQKNKIEI